MGKRILAVVCMIQMFLFAAMSGEGQQSVIEPETHKEFPGIVTFSHDGTDHQLIATGTAVRKKFVFRVYGMAHYMKEPPKADMRTALGAVLDGRSPKQITMDFVRSVGSGKIQEAFREGFEKNASRDDFDRIRPFIDQFCGYFDRELKENDVVILRWIPGGTVLTIVQGQEKPRITDETFARVLWSIWFGEHSIVDRSQLVKFLTR